VISKTLASRDKDLRFLAAAARHGLVDPGAARCFPRAGG
jgi:hypothetical protein